MVSVSVLSNLYKIKYSILNNTFQYLPESPRKKQYLMVIDIGKIISMILKIITAKDIKIASSVLIVLKP